jgi:hypothetical protein
MQSNHLYSVLMAARGYPRLYDQGAQIAQQYLSPFDLLIGLVGDSGAGKSVLIKGMFPGLELTNDDSGVNVRPLPLLDLDDTGFFSPHTYHVDIRFESAFTQMHVLASAIEEAVTRGKRVIIEHFELIYPFLKRNAHLLIGIGEEIVVTRPTVFGPEPAVIADIVFRSIPYRRMAHTAEDLVEYCLADLKVFRYDHSDVRKGFLLVFPEKPDIDLGHLEARVLAMIESDIPVSYVDENHVMIGDRKHYCTGPRMHMKSTGEIKQFFIYPEFIRDQITGSYMLIGLVGVPRDERLSQLNHVMLEY